MRYIVQVPTADRICSQTGRSAEYQQLLLDVRDAVGNADTASECVDYVLHCLVCRYFGVRPHDELNLTQLVGHKLAEYIKSRCMDFYYVESIEEFLEQSKNTSWLRNQFVGRCVSRTNHTLIIDDDPVLYCEDILWQIY